MAAVPLLVLAACVAGVFFTLTALLPPLAPERAPGGHAPAAARVLPFLIAQPFLTSFVCLCAGGLAYILGPRACPLRVAAWYLAGAFLLALWVALLVIFPQTCSYIGGSHP
ncbi:MAG TPA: hypothetical protein DCM87_18155 [Planctomycetes bacterium]|nr:hypothetical protein [Planctomycetota bacterium]